MDHLRRLESPFRVSLMVSAVAREPAARAQQRSVAEPSYERRNSSLYHSTDLKDRSRSEQSSNRDSPTCFVIPSEATRPNRGICIWFFLELKKGNRRSHPVQLHLLMWHLLVWHLLVWHGRLARVAFAVAYVARTPSSAKNKRASRSLPEAHRIHSR